MRLRNMVATGVVALGLACGVASGGELPINEKTREMYRDEAKPVRELQEKKYNSGLREARKKFNEGIQDGIWTRYEQRRVMNKLAECKDYASRLGKDMPYNELYELIYGNLEGTDTEEKLEKRLKQEGVNCEVQDERSVKDIVEGYEAGFPSFHYSHLCLAGIIGFLAGITIGNIARFRNLYKRNEDKENSENQ